MWRGEAKATNADLIRQMSDEELAEWLEKKVYDNAVVCGNAEVYDNAVVYEDAEVYGNAEIFGNAKVRGNALIQSSKHIVWFSSVGSENGVLTVYTSKSGEIEVTRGCFVGTLDEFEAAVRQKHNNTQYEKEYLLLIQFIKQFIKTRFQDLRNFGSTGRVKRGDINAAHLRCYLR